jgi:hypothetical protein
MFRVLSIVFFFAIPVFAGSDGEVIGDYNVGGGLLISDLIGGSGATDAGAGVVGNGEVVAMGDLKEKHLIVVDGRFVTFVGGGYQFNGNTGFFALRLMGNASFGLQAFQVVPLNLSFEDIELKIRNGEVEGHALIGTTVYIPVSMLAGLEASNLFIGITAGARTNSEASATAFGIQPKVRYITDDVSLEGRYLFTLGSDVKEQRAVVQAGLNHVFRRGDQLGLIVTRGHVDDQKGPGTLELLEGMIFYGGNL